MTLRSDEYQKARRLFHEALELGASEYPALLDRCCGESLELRQELERLLEAHYELPPFGVDGAIRRTRLGEYRILRELGRGGMGIVYEAEQESLGRRVALKVLPHHARTDCHRLERFRQEARAAASLDHPGIVPVYGIAGDGEEAFYVMQFIRGAPLSAVLDEARRIRSATRGESVLGEPGVNGLTSEARGQAVTWTLLADVLRRSNAPNSGPSNGARTDPDELPASSTPPPPSGGSSRTPAAPSRAASRQNCHRSAARIALQVAEALAYAHSHGVLHRDIKPSNLLLEPSGKVWITDFGLAKAEGSEQLTLTSDVFGTIPYMAPERFRGWSDPRSDIYGLGVTLYETLALRLPFEDVDQARLIRRVTEDKPVPPRKLDASVPRDLETIVLRAIDKDPESRYASARDLAEDLRRFLNHEAVLATRPSLSYRLRKFVRRNRLAVTAVVAVFLALTSGLLFSLAYYREATLARKEETRLRGEAEASLYRSLLDESRAVRILREPGWRRRVRALLGRAIGLDTPARNLQELRRESVATSEGFDAEVIACAEGRAFAWSMDFSPDGQLLAIAREDGVRVRTADSWETIYEIRHEGKLLPWFPAVRFTSGGDRLLYSNPEGGIEVLPLTPDAVAVLPPSRKTHAQFIDLDRSGNLLAVGWANGGAGVYDLQSGATKVTVRTGQDVDNAVALGPDGRFLATRGAGDRVLLHDTASGSEPRILSSTPQHIRTLAFSPDGELVVGSSRNHNVTVWRVASGEETFLRGHRARVQGAVFDATGRLVVSWGDDVTVRLWDARTGAEHLIIRTGLDCGTCFTAAIHPDRLFLAAACRRLSVLRLTTPQCSRDLSDINFTGIAAAFHPREPCFVSGGADKNLRVWKLEEARLAQKIRIPPDKITTTFAYSHDGALLAVAGTEFSNQYSGDFSIYVYSTEGYKIVRRIDGHTSDVTTLAFDSANERLLSGARDDVRLWSLTTATAERRWAFREEEVKTVGFVSGDALILTALARGRIALHDSKSGDMVREIKVPGGLSEVALGSRRRRLAVAGTEGALRVYGVPELEPELVVENAHRDRIRAVAFGAGGTLLASGGDDREVFLWDLRTRKRVLGLPPHNSRICDLAFDPHSRWLSVCPDEQVIRLWDMAAVRENLRERRLDAGLPRPSESAAIMLAASQPEEPRIVPSTASFDDSDGTLAAVLDRIRRARRRDPTRTADHVTAASRFHLSREHGQAVREYLAWEPSGAEADHVRWQLILAMEALVASCASGPPSDALANELTVALDALRAARRPALLAATPSESAEALTVRYERAAARLFCHAGAHREAKPHLERAIQIDPTDPGAVLELAKCVRRLGNSAQADDRLREAVRLLERNESSYPRDLEECREQLLPDLATYASIDWAIEEGGIEVLVPETITWRCMPGTVEPSPDWAAPAFDDSTWIRAEGPLGYDGDDEYRIRTSLDDMRGKYSTVYLRHSFDVADPASIVEAVLSIQVDDGCVVALNGTEVTRVHAGPAGKPVQFDASAENYAAEPLETRSSPLDPALLLPEGNLLTVHALNHGTSSSDFFFAATLSATRAASLERDRGRFAPFRKAAACSDASARVAYLEGRLLQRVGRYEEAADRFVEVLASDRRRPEPFQRLWECLNTALPSSIAVASFREHLRAGAPGSPVAVGPTRPTPLSPDGARSVGRAARLVASPFSHPDPRARHVSTRWEIRPAGSPYPIFGCESTANLTEIDVPAGHLLPRTAYEWTVAYQASTGVATTSLTSSFRTRDFDLRVSRFDLSPHFNADVIANAGDDHNDVFDGSPALLIEEGFDGERADNAQAQGLPGNRRIGLHVLGDYGRANAVQIELSGEGPFRLAVDAPGGTYSALRCLVAGGNGDSEVPIVFEYADGTREERRIPCDDWFDDIHELHAGSYPILNDMDRIIWGRYQEVNKAALFEVVLPLVPSKELTGFRIDARTVLGEGATTFNLFAVTGVHAE